MTNSCAKGKRGEREFASYLRSKGIAARRGQQFSGGKDSPDIVCGLTKVHFEVKRVQAGTPYEWLDQAIKDAGDNMPIVAHRKNNKKWLAIMPMDKLIELLTIREGLFL